MNPTFKFPESNAMIYCLCNHPSLSHPYNREKGITEAVANLAGARFASTEMEEIGIKYGARLLIDDLRVGKDGFTGKPLPNLGRIGLDSEAWRLLANATERALISCATVSKN